MAGLVPAIHVVRPSNVRERGKGESFAPAKLCCGPPHVGPVLKRCRRDSRDKPAVTPRAETNSKRYKSKPKSF